MKIRHFFVGLMIIILPTLCCANFQYDGVIDILQSSNLAEKKRQESTFLLKKEVMELQKQLHEQKKDLHQILTRLYEIKRYLNKQSNIIFSELKNKETDFLTEAISPPSTSQDLRKYKIIQDLKKEHYALLEYSLENIKKLIEILDHEIEGSKDYLQHFVPSNVVSKIQRISLVKREVLEALDSRNMDNIELNHLIFKIGLYNIIDKTISGKIELDLEKLSYNAGINGSKKAYSFNIIFHNLAEIHKHINEQMNNNQMILDRLFQLKNSLSTHIHTDTLHALNKLNKNLEEQHLDYQILLKKTDYLFYTLKQDLVRRALTPERMFSKITLKELQGNYQTLVKDFSNTVYESWEKTKQVFHHFHYMNLIYIISSVIVSIFIIFFISQIKWLLDYILSRNHQLQDIVHSLFSQSKNIAWIANLSIISWLYMEEYNIMLIYFLISLTIITFAMRFIRYWLLGIIPDQDSFLYQHASNILKYIRLFLYIEAGCYFFNLNKLISLATYIVNFLGAYLYVFCILEHHHIKDNIQTFLKDKTVQYKHKWWGMNSIVFLFFGVVLFINLLGYNYLSTLISIYLGVLIFFCVNTSIVFLAINRIFEFLSLLSTSSQNQFLFSQSVLLPIQHICKSILFFLLIYFHLIFLTQYTVLLPFNQYFLFLHLVNFEYFLNMPLFSVFNTPINILFLIKSILIFHVFSWSALWVKEFSYRWLLVGVKDTGKRNSISMIMHYIVNVVILAWFLYSLGITRQDILYPLTGLSFGFAFGMRNIVGHIFSGFFILLERPIKIDDWINVNGQKGKVTHIGIRAVTINTEDHVELIIPNSIILDEKIINLTHRDSIVRTVIPLRINKKENLTQLSNLVIDLIAETSLILKHPNPDISICSIDDSWVKCKIVYYVNIDKASLSMTRSQFLTKLLTTFNQHNIKQPDNIKEIQIQSSDQSGA